MQLTLTGALTATTEFTLIDDNVYEGDETISKIVDSIISRKF